MAGMTAVPEEFARNTVGGIDVELINGKDMRLIPDSESCRLTRHH
jgi:hypothetical protein